MFRNETIRPSFRESQSGTITIMFAFSLIVFFALIGLTIDGGRAMVGKEKVTKALDAAVLAATRAMMQTNPNDHDLIAMATEYFESNLKANGEDGVDYKNLQITIDRTSKTIYMSADAVVPTTFGRVVGLKSIDFNTATQATFSVRDIELGLALDVTGSMNDPSSGRRPKIDELKVAAKNLFDILMPDRGSLGDVRIGIAPYSASVNAGAYAARATDGTSTDGCVVERTGGASFTDDDPAMGRYFKPGKVALDDIDPTEGLSRAPRAYTCPNARVIPITNDKAALKRTVDSYRADGWTAGHLGAAWGWYLVSPSWDSIWPAASAPRAYNTKNLVKAVVLMTDGIFNTAYNNDDSAVQAIKLCDNMKADGVVVYTVGFTAPGFAKNTLKACASVDPENGEPQFYDAESGDELNAAFQDIAVKLTALRLDR